MIYTYLKQAPAVGSKQSFWPTSDHGACAVETIPNWKMFVFGGSVGNLTEKKKPKGLRELTLQF